MTLPRDPLGIGEIGEGIEHDSHSVIPHENRLFFPDSKWEQRHSLQKVHSQGDGVSSA